MIVEDIIKAAGRLKQGAVGIFPAKNGYMLIGSSKITSMSDKIRQIKKKSVQRILVNVTDAFARDKNLLKCYNSLPPHQRKFLNIFMYADAIFGFPFISEDQTVECSHLTGYAFAKTPYERLLIDFSGEPFLASGANLSDQDTPFEVSEIPAEIRDRVDFIIDVGPLVARPDYTVIHLDTFTIYRHGLFSKYMQQYIDKCIGK